MSGVSSDARHKWPSRDIHFGEVSVNLSVKIAKIRASGGAAQAAGPGGFARHARRFQPRIAKFSRLLRAGRPRGPRKSTEIAHS